MNNTDTLTNFVYRQKDINCPEEGRANINNVGLSTNTRNALLLYGGIFYIDELSEWTEEEIRQIPHIGEKGYLAICKAINENGVKLK